MNRITVVGGLALLALSSCTQLSQLLDTYQAGRTFAVTSSDGTVAIEVWDDECEDGDIITLRVGTLSRTVELTRVRQTVTTTLTPGRHALEILAVNGTGYKGNCDFTDANTHAIQVIGDLSGRPSTYSTFAAVAGAGTRHTIDLTIP